MWNSSYFEARNRLGDGRHGLFFSEKKLGLLVFEETKNAEFKLPPIHIVAT